MSRMKLFLRPSTQFSLTAPGTLERGAVVRGLNLFLNKPSKYWLRRKESFRHVDKTLNFRTPYNEWADIAEQNPNESICHVIDFTRVCFAKSCFQKTILNFIVLRNCSSCRSWHSALACAIEPIRCPNWQHMSERKARAKAHNEEMS